MWNAVRSASRMMSDSTEVASGAWSMNDDSAEVAPGEWISERRRIVGVGATFAPGASVALAHATTE